MQFFNSVEVGATKLLHHPHKVNITGWLHLEELAEGFLSERHD
jgi:hypothetical protein